MHMGCVNKICARHEVLDECGAPQNAILFVLWQNPYVITPHKTTLKFFVVIQSPKLMSVFLLAPLIQCTILFCAGLDRSLQFRVTTSLILADLATYRPYTITPKR